MLEGDTWTTANGVKIHIRDMTYTHITNAERYLRNKAEEANLSAMAALGCGFQSEEASYSADQDARRLNELESEFIAMADALREEIDRRGLPK